MYRTAVYGILVRSAVEMAERSVKSHHEGMSNNARTNAWPSKGRYCRSYVQDISVSMNIRLLAINQAILWGEERILRSLVHYTAQRLQKKSMFCDDRAAEMKCMAECDLYLEKLSRSGVSLRIQSIVGDNRHRMTNFVGNMTPAPPSSLRCVEWARRPIAVMRVRVGGSRAIPQPLASKGELRPDKELAI